jgi:TolA-binding protein
MKAACFAALACACAALLGCSRKPSTSQANTQAATNPPPQAATSPAPASQETRAGQEQRFLASLQSKMKNLDSRIDQLSNQVAASAKGTEAEVRQSLQDLRSKRAALSQELARLKTASHQAWTEASNAIVIGWDEAQKAYQNTKARLQKQ